MSALRSVGQCRAGRLRSLWEMIDLEGSAFYAVTRALRGLLTSVETSTQDDVIPKKARDLIIPSIRDLMPHLDALRAAVTWVHTTRVLGNLEDIQEMTYGHLADGLRQIDLRLQDELLFRKIFVINESEMRYYESPSKMFGTRIFPSALYEIDEAGKCLAMGRENRDHAAQPLYRNLYICEGASMTPLLILDL